MSDTPETDKAWKAGIKMSAEESEDFLRQHAERLERERDQARRDELDESKWAKHYFEACQNLERQFKEAREEDLLGPCKRPDLCMLDDGHVPCSVCPNDPSMAPSHALFGVRVRYVSDLLGEGFLRHKRNNPSDVFPKGHLTRIFNLPARRMANATVEDGKERRLGMWEVTPVFHPPNVRGDSPPLGG